MRGSTGPLSPISDGGQQPSNDVQEIKKIIKDVGAVCEKILGQKDSVQTPEGIKKMEKIYEEITGLNEKMDKKELNIGDNAKRGAALLQYAVQQVTMALHEIKPKKSGSERLKSSIEEAEDVLKNSNIILDTIKTRPGLPPVKSGTVGDFIAD